MLQEEHISKLSKLKELLDAGILTEKEFEEQKRTILSHGRTNQENTTSYEARQTTSSYRASQTASDNNLPSHTPKKKNSTLWIILGVVACVVLFVIILEGTSGDYSDGVNGFMSNSYSEIDNYINSYSDCYYREGNTVYYQGYQDYSAGEELLGSLLQNPDVLSIFGESVTDIGKMVSGTFREEVLSELISEDFGLIQLIANNGLTLCFKYADNNLYYYTPDEIKRRLPSPQF